MTGVQIYTCVWIHRNSSLKAELEGIAQELKSNLVLDLLVYIFQNENQIQLNNMKLFKYLSQKEIQSGLQNSLRNLLEK